jgi:hypothetical protein
MEKAIRVMIARAVKEIERLIPENYYRYNNDNITPTHNISSSTQTTTSKTNKYKLIFVEDFEKYGIGQTAPFGPWKGDKFPVKIGVQKNGQVGKILTTYEYRKICLSNIKVKDFIIEVDWIKNITLWFRVINQKPFIGYVVSAYDYNGEVVLEKVAGNTKIKIAQNKIKPSHTKWHTLKVIAKGPNIKVYMDGQLAIDIIDNDKTMQQAGTICVGGACCTSYVDNIKIYKIEK